MMSVASEGIVAEELPSGTVTLLLGDLEGSVGLWERDAESMQAAMGRVDELIANHIDTHKGACPAEQGEGDSFVLAFPRASDAVACAVDLQRAFADEPWVGELDLKFRMALHTGDIELRDDHRYVGPAINRCARLRNLGRGGQTLLSRVTEELVVDRLPAGAGLRDLGEVELRGMARPETVFQLTHPDLDDDLPPLQVTAPADSNLPTQITSFVGRDDEVAEVGRLLQQGRVVTLLGAGGIGKTRLALEAAARIKERFDHGAWWVDLAPLTDADLVAPTIATTVGVHQHAGEAHSDALVRGLGDRRLLLLVDNCEHLVEAAAELVDRVVHGCPGVAVLATSREPLGVKGETTLRVPSLPVPPDGDGAPEDAGRFGAVRLFVDRARGVQPGFRITVHNAAAVTEICRRLDGIPLAIELAAAKVRLLSPMQVAEGLANRFRMLTGGPRTAMPRQRTLEASVEWSHDLLSRQEQLVLARLSVFAGTFDLDATEAVCADDTIDADAVLDLLSGLVDRSLVQVTESSGQVRYRLLETVRVFAGQRLPKVDDVARVRGRHLAHFRTLVEQAQAGLVTDMEAWVLRLAAQVDDLRAAMDWAMASGAPLAIIEFVERAYPFWMVSGLYAEMHRRLRHAVTAPDLEPIDQARGNGRASILAQLGGDYPAAYAFADRAVTLADELDVPELRAHARITRAFAGYFTRRAGEEQIRGDLDAADELSAGMGAPTIRATFLVEGGLIEMDGWSLGGGTAMLEDGLALARASGLVHLEVIGLAYLAIADIQSGGMERGLEHAQQAVELARTLRFHGLVSFGLAYVASVHAWRGHETPARQVLAEARQVARQAGLQMFDVYALRIEGFLGLFFGGAAQLQAVADELLAVIPAVMQGSEEAVAQCMAGRAALLARDHRRAGAHFEGGRERALDPSVPFQLGRCLIGLGMVAEAEGDIEQAWAHVHDGLDVLATWGDPMGTADALETIAGLAVATGAPGKAARLLGAADGLREETGTVRMAIEAERHPGIVAATRKALGDDAYEQEFADGVRLSLEEAFAYARRGRGERGRPRAGWQSLTPAEVEVVGLVAEGLPNRQIAERLFVSVNTVKTHLVHVYRKLDVSTRAELAAEAARRDLAGSHPTG